MFHFLLNEGPLFWGHLVHFRGCNKLPPTGWFQEPQPFPTVGPPFQLAQVTELESSANFPAEMEKFQQVLTRVRESQMAVMWVFYRNPGFRYEFGKPKR